MVAINSANVKHVKSKKSKYIHHGRLAPARSDKQLLAALGQQYKIVHSVVNGDRLHVQVDDKVAA
jgi:hypothetical protein